MRVWLSLNPKTCDKFDYCNYYHLFSHIAKNNFPVANGVCLAHLLVTTKLCNCHISLNEISKGLTPKYIGKLFDIYQLSIIKFYLQKFEVCTLWGELRSHYPVSQRSDCLLFPRIVGEIQYFWNSFLYSSNY